MKTLFYILLVLLHREAASLNNNINILFPILREHSALEDRESVIRDPSSFDIVHVLCEPSRPCKHNAELITSTTKKDRTRTVPTNALSETASNESLLGTKVVRPLRHPKPAKDIITTQYYERYTEYPSTEPSNNEVKIF